MWSPDYDGVREVFGAHASFHVPYKANLDVIMGGEPFFLRTGDTSEHARARSDASRDARG